MSNEHTYIAQTGDAIKTNTNLQFSGAEYINLTELQFYPFDWRGTTQQSHLLEQANQETHTTPTEH